MLGDIVSSQENMLIKNRSGAEYVQKYGYSVSLALLDPACLTFRIPEIDGVIGYRIASKCAIVFGDPICSDNDIEPLLKAFHIFCAQKVKTIIHVAASHKFTEWALQNSYKAAIEFGKDIILNPLFDPKIAIGPKASNLRNKFNQSVKKGIQIFEYTNPNVGLEQEMESLGTRWLKNREGIQAYLYHVNIFADRTHKRWFYAKHNDKMLGVMVLNRLDAYQGWGIYTLMVDPQALPGTSEFLVLSVLDVLRTENCNFLAIGTMTTSDLGDIRGLGPIHTWFAKGIYKICAKILSLEKRQRYWKKFQPTLKGLFLLLKSPKVRLSEVMAIMRALNVNI